jgi:hypothetical protein
MTTQPLVKYGHQVVPAKGAPLTVGEPVYVPCIKQYGTLMDAGYPPVDGRLGVIVLNFNGFAVEVYPEVIGCKWVPV